MRVITLGSMDMFHVGHARLINKCLEMGETVIGLNTDEFYEKYRGYKPIMTYQERWEIITTLYPSVTVIPNGQETGDAKKVILDAEVDMIVVGSDWARKDYVGQLGITWDWLDEVGIGIAYVNYSNDISSTEIKKRCLSR